MTVEEMETSNASQTAGCTSEVASSEKDGDVATVASMVEETNTEEANEKAEDEMDETMDMESTASEEDSDTDFSGKDPELLLIKATQLKEEGNTHFKNKDYEQASRSYRRGTNTLKPLNKKNTGDDQVKGLLVTLQTNLSMMCFKLEKHRQAEKVAAAALSIDPTNVKARYRRAIARRKLGEMEQAKMDLREALKQDPTNVTVKKELVSLKKELEDTTKAQRKSLAKAFSSKNGGGLYDDKVVDEGKKQQEEAKRKKEAEEALKKRKLEWEDECVKRMAKGEEAISFEDWEKEEEAKEKKQKEEENRRKKEEQRKRREQEKQESDSDDDELTERELAELRGYKKTKDGRITSYFTREQSMEEKQMIGDIAPKKIETVNTGSQPTDSTTVASVAASKWNQAGTWEEKDATEWCRARLKQRLRESKCESGALVGLVTKVKDFGGHASVAVVSGKKRYIFDFHCELQFDVKDIETDDVVADGSFKLPDFCSTHHDELEVEFTGWAKSPSKFSLQAAEEVRLALASSVRESTKVWVSDFNANY